MVDVFQRSVCAGFSDLLLGTDSEGNEGILPLVKSMSVFIQRVPAAIFACTFKETLSKSAAIANRTLMTLICTIEK